MDWSQQKQPRCYKHVTKWAIIGIFTLKIIIIYEQNKIIICIELTLTNEMIFTLFTNGRV